MAVNRYIGTDTKVSSIQVHIQEVAVYRYRYRRWKYTGTYTGDSSIQVQVQNKSGYLAWSMQRGRQVPGCMEEGRPARGRLQVEQEKQEGWNTKDGEEEETEMWLSSTFLPHLKREVVTKQ